MLARLGDVPADGEKTVRGQSARAWRVGSLPASLIAEMEALRVLPDGTERFRSIEALIANVPPAHQPAATLAAFPDVAMELARQKAEILAPLLSKRARTRLPLAALARVARGQCANLPGGKPGLRTIEEWVRDAERRDHGRQCFDRPELYLPDSAPMSQIVPGLAPDAVLFPSLEAWLAEYEHPLTDKANPSDDPRLWHLAFADCELAQMRGLNARIVRRAAIERLAHRTSPLYTLGASALRKFWQRTFPIWEALGKNPDAFADAISDQRRENGKPPKFTLTRDESLCLRAHHLQRGSLALAVEWFVKGCTHRDAGNRRHHTGCTPATRALILAELDCAAQERKEPRWPDSLRRAGYVADEEKASFRGKKAMMNFESCDRRGLWFVDEAGERQDLRAGTIWESDDMSSNEPCRFEDPETGIMRGGRQILFTQDVFSAAWLGATALGRERDAYRVEDIADHMLALVESHGLPFAWRLERGVWENQFIDGIDVSQLTGKTDDVWGGLDVPALFKVLRTFKSKGKGTIESSFHHLQNLIAHESTSIGRYRGEFERGTQLMLAAQRATAMAEKHRTAEWIAAAASAWKPFWEMTAMGDAIARACQLFNTRPKKRRAHGREMVAPWDLYRSAIRREVPAGELWRFCPVKKLATVRQGAIETTANHYSRVFRFRVNGARDLHLEHGYPVLIAFHPGKPEQGCHVFNAGQGARNRDGFKFGELILDAPLAEDAPQFSLSRDEQDAFAMRRRAAAAVRSEFRAIMPAGRAAVRISIARDGRGNSATVETGADRDTSRGGGFENRNLPAKGDAQIQRALAANQAARFDYDGEAARLATEDAARLMNTLPE